MFDSYLPPDRLQRRCSASFLVSSGSREHDKRYYYTFAPFDACRLSEWRHSQRLPQHRDDAWSRLRLVFIAPTLFLFSWLKMPSFHVWLWLLLNGLVVNGISYIFWLKALEYGDTSVISNALYVTPFLSLVSITLFLGEQILLSSIVGLIIIVVGILLQSVNLRQKMPGREEMDMKN